MAFACNILADSVSPAGVRLTTFEVTFPRIVLAEFNTHRVLSRNSASSRAIPVAKMIQRVMEDPYIPTSWGKNQKGMQAGEDLDREDAQVADSMWLTARDQAVERAQKLLDLGVHKQITNRLLEPWMWQTVIVTTTEWSNFFNLRNHSAAHPDIQTPARMMQQLYESHEPEKLGYGEWHLPLVQKEERNMEFGCDSAPSNALSTPPVVKISAGRCARVSYLTHDGKRDPAADIALHDSLLASGHMSPFEHVARPAHLTDDLLCMAKVSDLMTRPNGEVFVPKDKQWHGNFRGWVQYRKTIPGESDMLGYLKQQERSHG